MTTRRKLERMRKRFNHAKRHYGWAKFVFAPLRHMHWDDVVILWRLGRAELWERRARARWPHCAEPTLKQNRPL